MLNHVVMRRFGTSNMIFTSNFFSVCISANLTAFLNSLPPKTYKWTSWSKKLIKSNILSPKLLYALAPLVEKCKFLNRNILKTKKDVKKFKLIWGLLQKHHNIIKNKEIPKDKGLILHPNLLNYNGMTQLNYEKYQAVTFVSLLIFYHYFCIFFVSAVLSMFMSVFIQYLPVYFN